MSRRRSGNHKGRIIADEFAFEAFGRISCGFPTIKTEKAIDVARSLVGHFPIYSQ